MNSEAGIVAVSNASTSAVTSASLVKFDVFKLGRRRRVFQPEIKQQDRTDDRHDESGRMKRRPRLRLGKHTANQSADDRTGDAQQRAFPESEASSQGQLRNPANNGTNNDRPNNV